MNTEYLSIRAVLPWAEADAPPGGRVGRQISRREEQEMSICLHCPRPRAACDGKSTCPLLRQGRQGERKQAAPPNDELRAAIRTAGLTQKQVYEALHIKRAAWYARLSRELSEEFREKVFRTIAELKNPKEILDTYDLPSCRNCGNRTMCERDHLTCSARAKEQAV